MRLHRLAAAAALAIAALHAQAVTTYTFGVAGTQIHFLDSWECPGSVCAPDTPLVVTSDWSGTFMLTAPDGDGSFTFDGSSFEPNLKLTFSQYGFTTLFSFGIPPGPLFGATISGGQVTALSGSGLLFNVLPPGQWTFDGARVTFDNPAQHHYGRTIGSGTMALPAPVPEPETWAMLLAGLGITGVLHRRRSRIGRVRELAAPLAPAN